MNQGKDKKAAAEQHIKNNYSFFITPLKDQDKFIHFYKKKQRLKDIIKYSNPLMELLEKCLILTDSGTISEPVLTQWLQGNFESALNYECIQDYLLDNANHSALTLWNVGHGIHHEKQTRHQRSLSMFTPTNVRSETKQDTNHHSACSPQS